MNENMPSEVHDQLMKLRAEHRELDAGIKELELADAKNQFEISRLKRRKLQLKDEITRLEGLILPDIIA